MNRTKHYQLVVSLHKASDQNSHTEFRAISTSTLPTELHYWNQVHQVWRAHQINLNTISDAGPITIHPHTSFCGVEGVAISHVLAPKNNREVIMPPVFSKVWMYIPTADRSTVACTPARKKNVPSKKIPLTRTRTANCSNTLWILLFQCLR